MAYGEVIALVGWATRNWSEFDGWCCVQAVDPMALSSGRFLNLVRHYLRDGLSGEGLEKMNRIIEEAGRVSHPWLEQTPASKEALPPVGWKSDEENWAGIQAFLHSGVPKAVSHG